LDYVCTSDPRITVRYFKHSNYILVLSNEYRGLLPGGGGGPRCLILISTVLVQLMILCKTAVKCVSWKLLSFTYSSRLCA